MRWLSLIAAFVLLVAVLVGFMGGLGPLIAIGEYSEALSLPSPAVWALAIVYLGAFFGGIICCIVCVRGLGRAFGSVFDRALTIGDWSVILGHCVFVAAIANIVSWRLGLREWDLAYLLLMVAAALYSLGLGALAVRFRAPQPSVRADGFGEHAP